jgi:arabinofuranosyltransferase
MVSTQGGTDPAQGPDRIRLISLRVGWALIGLGFLLHLRQWAFLCDDAFISFRYARNFAQHGALVYNVEPLEHVEGYTNLLWVLVLAAGDVIGVAPTSLAPVLTAISSLASLFLVTWLVRRLREATGQPGPASPVDLVPALWLVAVPEFVVWGSGGLETSFALALILGAMVAWMHARMNLAAGLSAAAALTRLDSLLVIGAFGLAWLGVFAVKRFRERGSLAVGELPWKQVGIATLIFVSPIVTHLLWRHSYYGEWLPNTWAIKKHGALLRDSYGTTYVELWAENLNLWWMVVLIPFVRARHLTFLLPVVSVAVYAWSVGGDFMAYSRFLLPATALVGGLVGWALADLQDWLTKRSGRPWVPAGAAVGVAWAALLAAGLGARLEVDRDKAWIPTGREYPKGLEGVHGMDEFARVRVAAGNWMRENLPTDTLVSVGAAGAMPYASELPVFDVYGLVDPGVLDVAEPITGKRARPGHQLYAPASYVKRREPDLMCHNGRQADQKPSPGDARRAAGRKYVWACAEPGEVEDYRGTIDAGVYCCLRHRDHVVGPFGSDGGAGDHP